MESGGKKSNGIYEHFYRKYNAEVSLYVKIAHAAPFRNQCEQQNNLSTLDPLLQTWVNMFKQFFVCNTPFEVYI